MVVMLVTVRVVMMVVVMWGGCDDGGAFVAIHRRALSILAAPLTQGSVGLVYGPSSVLTGRAAAEAAPPATVTLK